MRYTDADAHRARLVSVAEHNGGFCNCNMGLLMAISELDSAPTADVAPVVRGEWEQHGEYDEDANVYECSACGEPWVLEAGNPNDNNMNYCPNCGARMEGGGQDA